MGDNWSPIFLPVISGHYFMKHTFFTRLFFTGSLLMASMSGNAFDSARDSTVDKADRFEFEDFHKDNAVTLWGKDKDKQEDAKKAQGKLDKDQELNVRSPYKLSADPALAAIPTLSEAILDLHEQLNGFCPTGWKKEEEWHLPEANYFYIHYRAKCL